MKHVEHGLCEFKKFFRLATGESQGGRIYRPSKQPSGRQCALCGPEQDLVEEITPWVICGSSGRLKESRWNNLASSFVKEEAREKFTIRRVSMDVKKISINFNKN